MFYYITQFRNCQVVSWHYFEFFIGREKMNNIYIRIENLCKDNAITITELCRNCSIPRATMSDFKMGRCKSLSAAVLSKIASYFSVSVEFLLEGENRLSTDDELKVALFGGSEFVTDAMWEEVKRYARYVKERENGTR